MDTIVLKINTNILKSKRIEKGYSQENLAKKLNMSSITYGAKERGEYEFTPTEILKLALILNLTLSDVNIIFFANKVTEMLNMKQ